MSKLLSEQEILNRGIIKNVILTLDDGDEHYPSSHWANTAGTRMYEEERVKLAEELISSCYNGQYYHANAEIINHMYSPVTTPLVIFDYRIILSHINPNLELNISMLRTSHPYFGRMQDTSEREIPLVTQALIELANYSNKELDLKTENGLLYYLESLIESAKTLFNPPWPDVILRRQILRRNIFSGKSPKAAHKILQILSLICSGIIPYHLVASEPKDLVALLVASPVLRIDPKIMIWSL